MACSIVKRTDIHSFEFDNLVATLGVEQLEFALRLVRARLADALTRARAVCAKLAEEPTPTLEDDAEYLDWRIDQDPKKSGEEPARGLAGTGRHRRTR